MHESIEIQINDQRGHRVKSKEKKNQTLREIYV